MAKFPLGLISPMSGLIHSLSVRDKFVMFYDMEVIGNRCNVASFPLLD